VTICTPNCDSGATLPPGDVALEPAVLSDEERETRMVGLRLVRVCGVSAAVDTDTDTLGNLEETPSAGCGAVAALVLASWSDSGALSVREAARGGVSTGRPRALARALEADEDGLFVSVLVSAFAGDLALGGFLVFLVVFTAADDASSLRAAVVGSVRCLAEDGDSLSATAAAAAAMPREGLRAGDFTGVVDVVAMGIIEGVDGLLDVGIFAAAARRAAADGAAPSGFRVKF